MQYSLAGKMMMTLTLVMLCVSLAVATLNYQFTSRELSRQQLRQATTLLELAAQSLSEPLASGNQAQIENLLNELLRAPDVNGLTVRDSRTQRSTSVSQKNAANVSFRLNTQVMHHGQALAMLDIEFNNQALRTTLKTVLLQNLAVTAVLLLATLGTVWLLTRRHILRPVKEVSLCLAQIARGEADLSRRTNTKIDAQEIVKGCASGVLKCVLKNRGWRWIPVEFRKQKKRHKAAISVASRRSVGLSGSKYGTADGIITHPPSV